MAMMLTKGSRGELVKKLQAALNLIPDGIFGSLTEESVKAFQKANGLKQDGIVGEKTWMKLFPPTPNISKSKRNIKEIIVHCTATPAGRVETVSSIRNMHIARGWSDIGYHYLIGLNGEIWNGRNVNLIGAHCKNHNANSIGVCYVGGVEGKRNDKGVLVPKLDKNGNTINVDTRTKQQKESLLKLLKELKQLYPTAKIYGHHDFEKGKSCPCFDAKREYEKI